MTETLSDLWQTLQDLWTLWQMLSPAVQAGSGLVISLGTWRTLRLAWRALALSVRLGLAAKDRFVIWRRTPSAWRVEFNELRRDMARLARGADIEYAAASAPPQPTTWAGGTANVNVPPAVWTGPRDGSDPRK